MKKKKKNAIVFTGTYKRKQNENENDAKLYYKATIVWCEKIHLCEPNQK